MSTRRSPWRPTRLSGRPAPGVSAAADRPRSVRTLRVRTLPASSLACLSRARSSEWHRAGHGRTAWSRGATSPWLARPRLAARRAIAALVGVGLWAIDGITCHDFTGDPSYYLVRPGHLRAARDDRLFRVALFVDPKHLSPPQVVGLRRDDGRDGASSSWSGEAARGSRRWIDLGFFRFQPSEFGKLLFILFLAAFLADSAKRLDEWRTTGRRSGSRSSRSCSSSCSPTSERRSSTRSRFSAPCSSPERAGLHLAVIGTLAALFVTAVLWFLPAGGIHILKPYQQDRLTAFLHPDKDPSGSGYNIIQSKIGVGAGGLTGRGMTRLDADELQLPAGARDGLRLLVLRRAAGIRGRRAAARALLAGRLERARIVTIARDRFSAIAAGTIVVAFLFQVFVNVGMTIGLAPITGIPLPFVSVGGSVDDHEPGRHGRAARDRRASKAQAAGRAAPLVQAAAGRSFARRALTARSRWRRRAQAQGSTSLYLASLWPRVASRYSNQASASSMSSSSNASRCSSGTAGTSPVVAMRAW